MEAIQTQEAKEDLFFGQVVIMWARWSLILAGAILIFWNAQQARDIVLGIIPLAILMVMNFYLHGRYIMESPVGGPLIVLASVVDLVLITLLILFWPVGEKKDIPIFIFYYPVVLAFGFVVTRWIEAAYTVAAIVLYTLVSLFWLFNGDIQGNLRSLLLRLLVVGAMGFLGNYYWRIQRARRRTAIESANGGR